MPLTPLSIILSVCISVFVLGCQTPVKNPVDRQIRDQTMMSFDEYQNRMQAMFVFMWTYSMR